MSRLVFEVGKAEADALFVGGEVCEVVVVGVALMAVGTGFWWRRIWRAQSREGGEGGADVGGGAVYDHAALKRVDRGGGEGGWGWEKLAPFVAH